MLFFPVHMYKNTKVQKWSLKIFLNHAWFENNLLYCSQQLNIWATIKTMEEAV